MAERRFFVEPAAIGPEHIELSGEVLHHIVRVLRLVPGDEILLLDGTGRNLRCALDSASGGTGRATILEQWVAQEYGLAIQLIQALPKGEKFDLILQKGTELGISRFTPVSTERCVQQVDVKRSDKKQQRWQRIIAEAARQSRRQILPVCDPVLPLAESLKGCRQQLKLLLWEEESRPLADCLPVEPPASAAILVGPEGGISRSEVALALAAGFLPVSLGPRILRTETAGFAVTAVLEYLYGDFGGGNEAKTECLPGGD